MLLPIKGLSVPVTGIYCVVGRSTGVVCAAEGLSLLVLLGFTLIASLDKSSRLLVENTRSARAKELVGTTGNVCLVPETSLAGSVDVETSHGVLIWPMGGHVPLLSLTVAKGLLACIRVWFVKLDELGTKVSSCKTFDLSKDTDVCFKTLLECTVLLALVLSTRRINVGETVNEETVPSFFISTAVVF